MAEYQAQLLGSALGQAHVCQACSLRIHTELRNPSAFHNSSHKHGQSAYQGLQGQLQQEAKLMV
jgi:hypothetical protein